MTIPRESLVSLYGFQEEAVESVLRLWPEHRALLGVAACGMGKTIVLLEVLHRVLSANPRARAMIIAHRKELIEQPIERMRQFWPWLAEESGVVMANDDDVGKRVIVGTVQTLSMEHRLKKVLAWGKIDYLIVDEAHHVCSKTYMGLVASLNEANPEMRHLGVTATPKRLDAKGLKTIYSEVAFREDIKTLIGKGRLVPPRWLAIQTGISVASVAIAAGDFVGKQLADVFETDNCFDLVVESHKKFAEGRKALAFVQSVDGAYRLAEKFNAAGIPAAAADGTTAKARRSEIMRDFRADKLQVLANCALFTEGLDVPTVSCIHMIRPTKSDSFYIQCVGRGLRTAPAKQDCTVLDYCPAEARDVIMLGDVLGTKMRKDQYIEAGAERGKVIGGFTYDGKMKWLVGDPNEIVSRQLDYLELTPYAWFRGEGGWLSLGLGKGPDGNERTLLISPPTDEGLCRLWKVGRREDDRVWRPFRGEEATFEELSEIADGIVTRYADAGLSERNRGWRKQPASLKQVNYAQSLQCWREGMSRGDLAQAITHALAMRAVRRAY